MSSPPAVDSATADAPPKDPTLEEDVEIDTEMADTQANAGAANGAPSSNTDQDMQEAQPQPTAAQHNRKDATLREFLSKMDDYAPIVRGPFPCPDYWSCAR